MTVLPDVPAKMDPPAMTVLIAWVVPAGAIRGLPCQRVCSIKTLS